MASQFFSITPCKIQVLTLFVTGFVFSRLLEKYKLRESLAIEFRKKRFEKITALWEQLISDEMFIFDELALIARSSLKGNDVGMDMWTKGVIDYVNKCNEKSGEFQERILRDYFWLGKENYSDLVVYYNKINKYIDGLSILSPEKIKETAENIKSSRPDFSTIVQRCMEIKI